MLTFLIFMSVMQVCGFCYALFPETCETEDGEKIAFWDTSSFTGRMCIFVGAIGFNVGQYIYETFEEMGINL